MSVTPPETVLPSESVTSATADPQMRRMLWHCRRGLKELDVLLERFARQVLPAASAEERQLFAELLALSDPELEAYLVLGAVPQAAPLAHLTGRIRALCRLDDGSALFCR